MVVAQVRKGAPKTKKINKSKKKVVSEAIVEPVSLVNVLDGAEVTEQLRKFENMLLIQRLDSLLDMQKMQWTALDRITGLLETLNMLAGEQPQHDQLESDYDDQAMPNVTEALEELIGAKREELSPGEDAAKEENAAKDAKMYDGAEQYARKVSKVRNDIN